MSLIVINKSILNADEQYIAHQCNCMSKTSAGLAKSLFDKFPYANVYSQRTSPDKLGTIKICGDGIYKRYVINMFAQYYPGKSKYDNDSVKIRLKAFENCLAQISLINDLESIAFPYNIGCGLAGGDWDAYLGLIEKFSLTNNVYLYKV